MNLRLEEKCLHAIETAIAFDDDSLNANISKNLNEAMKNLIKL
jgi:hypothetical protein